MSIVAELETKIAQLSAQLESLAEDMRYADGPAYSQDKQRFTAVREELFEAQAQLRALTVHSVEMPEYVRMERTRERLEEARKERERLSRERINDALERMNAMFK